jgi:hypothetical protein
VAWLDSLRSGPPLRLDAAQFLGRSFSVFSGLIDHRAGDELRRIELRQGGTLKH